VSEARRTFECFGGLVGVSVLGPESMEPERAAAAAEARLLAAHRQLSRFLPGSELSRLNRDPRTRVPADPLLLRLASGAREAGELGGTAPCVLNAANEVAVEAFLGGELGFTGIPEVIERTLDAMPLRQVTHFQELFEADAAARDHASGLLGGALSSA